MLLCNYSQINRNTGRLLGNAFTNPLAQRLNPMRASEFYVADSVRSAELPLSGWPHGYGADGWELPRTPGAMAAHATCDGASTLSADIAGGYGIEAALDGSGGLTGDLGALAGLVAALTGLGAVVADISGTIDASASLSGSGTISSAAMGLIAGMLADLAGSGALSADITATVDASASLSGTGSLTAAITGLSDIVASLTGSGSMTASVSALGQMSADITVGAAVDPLSPSALAAAVWNAVAASFNTVGSMGALMNGGAAGGLTSEQAEQLLAVFQILGLDPTKPMVQVETSATTTTRKVPADGSAIDQTVVEGPPGTHTLTRLP